MLEPIIEFLSGVPWYWVLIVAFLVTILENVFPPAPCDSVIIFQGALVSFDVVGFFPLLLVSTAGSILGFSFMFWLGIKFGTGIIESNKFKFLKKKKLAKVERWFHKYGYMIIVINRFMSGTRGVISFFAGITKLQKTKTIIYASVSALVWNTILITLGFIFGEEWEAVINYVKMYGRIIAPILAAIGIFFLVRWYIISKRNKKEKENS